MGFDLPNNFFFSVTDKYQEPVLNIWQFSLLRKIAWYLLKYYFKTILGKDSFCLTVCATFSSVQFSCSVLSDSCHPMDCSTPVFPVHHQLPELTQTHVHQVDDVIQPSHPLSSLSPPAFNLFQHQGLFQRVSSSHQVAKYWNYSFSIRPSNEYSGLISFRMHWFGVLKWLSRVFSNTTVQKHQLFSAQLSL